MTDHEAIQGYWKLIDSTLDGQPHKNPELGTLSRFHGNRFIHVRTRLSCRFELQSDVTPKGLDFKLVSCNLTAQGLYELEGDTLRIMRADGWSKPRPASFDEPGHIVETYSRFKRRIAMKRRVKAQIPDTMVPDSFIPKGLFPASDRQRQKDAEGGV
jgi:uncharacterized protein (TIGR03067 family)